MSLTWTEALTSGALPAEFVQWVVARFGPLPDGPIDPEDYQRFAEAYRDGHTRSSE